MRLFFKVLFFCAAAALCAPSFASDPAQIAKNQARYMELVKQGMDPASASTVVKNENVLSDSFGPGNPVYDGMIKAGFTPEHIETYKENLQNHTPEQTAKHNSDVMQTVMIGNQATKDKLALEPGMLYTEPDPNNPGNRNTGELPGMRQVANPDTGPLWIQTLDDAKAMFARLVKAGEDPEAAAKKVSCTLSAKNYEKFMAQSVGLEYMECGEAWREMGDFSCVNGKQRQKICGCRPPQSKNTAYWIREGRVCDECYSHWTGEKCSK